MRYGRLPRGAPGVLSRMAGRFAFPVSAPATWLLVFCCFAGYLALTLRGGLGYALGFESRFSILAYYERHGLVPAELGVADGTAWLGMLTGIFLHVGPFHLAVNLVGLRCFGRVAETAAGWQVLLPVYFFSGVMGAMCHAMAYPDSRLALVGASGAVSGLLGFNLLLRGWDWGPAARWGVSRWRVSASWLVGLWFVQQGIYLLLAWSGSLDLSGTALALHAGGMTAGLAAAWLLRGMGRVR